MNKCLSTVWLIGFCCILSACTDAREDALNHQLQKIQDRSPGEIPPLPPVPVNPRTTYAANAVKSPFRTVTDNSSSDTHAPSDRPRSASDTLQPKHPQSTPSLKQLSLDKLTLVGTLQFADAATPLALIDNGQGEIHRVMVGQYLGQPVAKVTRISEQRVELEARVQDEQGEWHTRRKQLKLAVNTDDE